MIINFELPHPIGAVCRYPCAHCGESLENDTRGSMRGIDGQEIERAALFIVRAASREEFLAYVRSQGGNPTYILPYFYQVLAD